MSTIMPTIMLTTIPTNWIVIRYKYAGSLRNTSKSCGSIRLCRVNPFMAIVIVEFYPITINKWSWDYLYYYRNQFHICVQISAVQMFIAILVASTSLRAVSIYMLVLEIYIEKTANDAHNMIPIRATNDHCECRFMAIVIVEFYPITINKW